MNTFEFAFFDELQKLATDRGAVASARKRLEKQYPNASKADIGQAATREAQRTMRTSSIFDYEGRKSRPIRKYDKPVSDGPYKSARRLFTLPDITHPDAFFTRLFNIPHNHPRENMRPPRRFPTVDEFTKIVRRQTAGDALSRRLRETLPGNEK
jgi:hypothetical protein